MVYECTTCTSSLITSAAERNCHLQSTQVLFSKWFSLETSCCFPFSKVVSVPVVCLFRVSIRKKPSTCPVFSMLSTAEKMVEFAGLPRLLFLLKLISPSSRDLRSCLQEACFLKLYLEGHQSFPSKTALSLCQPSENVLATKPVIMYATQSFCVA